MLSKREVYTIIIALTALDIFLVSFFFYIPQINLSPVASSYSNPIYAGVEGSNPSTRTRYPNEIFPSQCTITQYCSDEFTLAKRNSSCAVSYTYCEEGCINNECQHYCTDSDLDDVFNRGSITTPSGMIQDYCSSVSSVMEGICDPDPLMVNVPCPNSFYCSNGACTENPNCNNGVHEPQYAEQCDDGNIENNDACTVECKTNVCGDTYIFEGSEECDDGNLIGDDGCESDCTRTPTSEFMPITSCNQPITEDSILVNNILCLNTGLIISSSNLILDCDNFNITGDGSEFKGSSRYVGISISGKSNITIKNCNFQKFGDGAYISNANNILFEDSRLENNWIGFYIRSSSNKVTITKNQILGSKRASFKVIDSNNVNLLFNNALYGGNSSAALGGTNGDFDIRNSANISTIENTFLSYKKLGYVVNPKGKSEFIGNNFKVLSTTLSGNVWNQGVSFNTNFQGKISIKNNLFNLTESSDIGSEALEFLNITDSEIINNSFFGFSTALAINSAKNISISNNTFSSTGDGLFQLYSNDSMIISNNFESSLSKGIYTIGSYNFIVSANNFRNAPANVRSEASNLGFGYWNLSTKGNNWDDYTSNGGYSTSRYILYSGNLGIDYHPTQL